MKSQLEETLARHIRAAGLPVPNREYRFHPTRRWRFDFAFVDDKVSVEVDGGVWIQGRHTRPSGFIEDMHKMNEAAILGWTVIRVTGDMIRKGEALQLIERALGKEKLELN